MPAKFDRSRIMKEAHFLARWRVLTVGGSYRAWFAKTLAAEWRKARERAARREWNKTTPLESNLGLPLRSCPADAAPRSGAFAGVVPISRLFTRTSGRIAGSFAA
ncbi:hypothetical protein [Methylocystis bryophila]|uniref:Uncharacterized protein n=1 Tax=Methylocystis bryophila TaxID=655015 RepID=A0A1W6MSU5_9HYPH|nr:hypothetical protein [Methylocystis bryophila]ARN80668.1 hypothetical protein B1812_05825 [Methylocystis bryophila]BDV40737.1 hypothetical protein DSM21852_39900 [Methylocystis bryophila]